MVDVHYIHYIHDVEAELRRLLANVNSLAHPETAQVRDYLGEQLGRTLASLEQHVARASGGPPCR